MKYSFFAILHFLTIYAILNSIRWVFPSLLPGCCACNVALYLLIFVLTFEFTKKKFLSDVIDPHKKAIFISGCDTGFGNLLAKRMDSKGYHVFAGCLFPDGPDATRLKESCSQRLKIVGIDVTKDESVEKAAEFVKTNLNTCDFWAVVNNAGIQKGFSVEVSELKDFKDVMEVNALGPVRVTKAFLSLLKKSKGRVVTVTSLAGRCTIPYATPYFMSKYAAVGFSDCLRQELAEYGIKVISIEPELFATNITDKKRIEGEINNISKSTDLCQKEDGKAIIGFLKKHANAFLYFACPRVELVVNDLERAITFNYPDLIYKPRRNIFARFLIQVYQIMPTSFRDLLVKLTLYILKLFR